VVEKALQLIFSKFKNQNIDIIKDFEDISFEGYDNELIQVFINILNNAKDELTTKTNQKKLISISIKQVRRNQLISFQDNGGGIPKETLPNIFKSHFTTKEDHGTGIGLYMSKMIIENMNGTIDATNEEFEFEGVKYSGARFTITF